MEQRGRFVLFIFLSVGILMGWMLVVQPLLWPPGPRDPAKKETKKDEKKKPSDEDLAKALARLPGVALANIAVNRFLGADPVVDLVWLHLSPKTDWSGVVPQTLTEDQRRFAALAVALDPTLWPQALPGLARLARERFPEPAPPAEKAETVTIGGDGFFIEANLSTLGGGVQSLTLTQFDAANGLGEPIPGKKLQLIGDDPFMPSFLMYHYPDPKKDPEVYQPVVTLGDMHWKLERDPKTGSAKTIRGDVEEVRFSTPVPDPAYKDLLITKTYRLEKGAYHLTLTLEIENKADAKPVEFRYQLAGSHGMPLEGQWFATTYRDALIALVDRRGNVDRNRQEAATISTREGGHAFPETTTGSEQIIRYAGVALQYFASIVAVEGDANFIAWARPTKESAERPGEIVELGEDEMVFRVGSKGVLLKYALLPRAVQTLKENSLTVGSSAVVSEYLTPDGRRVANWVRRGNSPRPYFDDITVRLNSEAIKISPGGKARHEFTLYHGPSKVRLLGQFGGDKAVPAKFVDHYIDDLKLNTITDYRSSGFFGWLSQKIMFTNLLIFVTNLMHTLLFWLHFVVGWYGLAIILLTVVVRGLMFPISRKQALFSIRMQELAPELKKLQEKYKGDPRARTEATMEFYRKHKINPLASCFPLLMQLPIFLGLYFALQESIHFRLARFLWIDNLAAPDMLFYWSQSIPWISDPDNIGGMLYLGPFFNLLPIIAVVLMLVQQAMMSPPALDEQQAMQMKIMKFMMMFIGILFYKVAAGLAIYFIASSVWGLAERRILPRKQTATAEPASLAISGKGPIGKGGAARGKPAPEAPPSNGPFARLKRWWQNVLEEARKK